MPQFSFGSGLSLLAAISLAATAAQATQDDDPRANLDAPIIDNLNRGEADIARSESAVVTNKDLSTTIPGPVSREYGPVAGSGSDVPTGSLSGRIIYLMAGHGWEHAGSNSFTTQRGVTNGMVEDMGNLDQVSIMAQYLLNAGATVVPMRPIAHQDIEVVVDNDDPSVTFTGTWSNSSSTVFYGTSGDTPYRFASVTSGSATATARFDATIPESGFYPVYVWTRSGSDRINQEYIVGFDGGTATRRIHHRKVGTGWIYLGTFYFEQSGTAYVEITNQAEPGETGTVVIADAVRFGNGMGDVLIDGATAPSGKPREEEHGRYWAVESAAINAAIDFTDDGTYGSVNSPRELAQLLNRETEGTQLERMYLSFHSNAGGGRGADGLFNSDPDDPGTTTINEALIPNSQNWNDGDISTGDDLAQFLGDAINTDMTTLTNHPNNPLPAVWGNAGGGNETYASGQNGFSAYGEQNYALNPEMPQCIIEVAFHDNSDDARIMLDPRGRDALARATLRGMLNFFNNFDAGSTTMLPSPPKEPYVEDTGAQVTLSWTPPVAGGDYGVGGDAPTAHRIYVSENGFGFDFATEVAGGTTSSADVSAYVPANSTRYFRVTAINAGGESFPTETVAVHRDASRQTAEVLIVNGFDRYDRFLAYEQTEPSPGTFDRVITRYNNSFDYSVTHATALENLDVRFDTCSNEAVINGDVLLTDYRDVYWILGEESTVDETFSTAEQTLVTSFLTGGGNLFVSGAEIAWDLGWSGSSGDQSFLNNQLRVNTPLNGTTDDDAGTYNVNGSGIFSGISLTFSDGSTKELYGVEFPDILRPNTGASTVMTYSGGTGNGESAAISYDSGTHKVIVLGFPFETILDEADRDAVIAAAHGFFNGATSVDHWMMLGEN